MSLRRSLVLLNISLVAVGLLVFGVTSYKLFCSSESQRIHTQLTQTVEPNLVGALCQQAHCPQPDSPQTPPPSNGDAGASTNPSRTICAGNDPTGYNNLPGGSFAVLRSTSGQLLARLYVAFPPTDHRAPTCPAPALPAELPKGSTSPGRSPATFTAKAVHGPGPFMVEATRGPGFQTCRCPNPTVLIVGVPLNDLTASLHRLFMVDVVVGGILLAALALGSLLFIRRSLRPLSRMAATSRAISTGDLSRRVSATDDRTEIGQLGLALNGMLTRIENAFSERDATEQRLRQFLADASHELRTPLTSIRGYAELWRLDPRHNAAPSTALPPGTDLDATTAMARIEQHARRMGEMIEELLLLARLDEFHPVRNVPVDLAVIAAEACDDATLLDPGRPISLDADDNVVVIGEASHLRRAASNLLTNAVRHTPRQSRIEVHVFAGDGVAQIVVRDHGPGISAAGLAHAFDRFWQADVSRATGGTGLGLAIVAGVAVEHGGAATVANAPDGGAVFSLRLPLPRPDEIGSGVIAVHSYPAETVPGTSSV